MSSFLSLLISHPELVSGPISPPAPVSQDESRALNQVQADDDGVNDPTGTTA